MHLQHNYYVSYSTDAFGQASNSHTLSLFHMQDTETRTLALLTQTIHE